MLIVQILALLYVKMYVRTALISIGMSVLIVVGNARDTLVVDLWLEENWQRYQVSVKERI